MSTKVDVSHIQRCIKNQEINVSRLKKCLALAVGDNGEDKFKINRMLLKHTKLLHDLQKSLGEAIKHAKYLEGVQAREDKKAEEAAIRRLRIEIQLFDFDKESIHV